MSSTAQEFEMSLLVKRMDLDINTLEKKEYEAFSEFSKNDTEELFHFKGTTFPIPYSPVYRWNLFVAKKEMIELVVTNEHSKPVTKLFSDNLDSGLYRIELNGLWDIKKPTYYTISAKSKLKSSSITFFFLGRDVLLPPENGLIISPLNSSALLDDSLSIRSTVNKETLVHFKEWMLNVPKTRQLTFQLFGHKDSSLHHYETQRLKPGLYEIRLDSSINSGKYRLEVETYDAKLEEIFTLIK